MKSAIGDVAQTLEKIKKIFISVTCRLLFNIADIFNINRDFPPNVYIVFYIYFLPLQILQRKNNLFNTKI